MRARSSRDRRAVCGQRYRSSRASATSTPPRVKRSPPGSRPPAPAPQSVPATWIQYGVDALNAGYADPYNPVDAIFAAARYLRAAGASSNLRAAILAYNHSAEYVSSVLLRAKLISSYPNPVIATLTGLTDGRPPVSGKRLRWGAPISGRSSSSATASATALTANAAVSSSARVPHSALPPAA